MIALITGASSGIGRAMAKNLASKGFNLILVARRQERLEELKAELKSKYDIKIKIICKDLSVPQNCIDLHDEVQKVGIDILINNAGFGLFGRFDQTDLDTELKMIDINIKAVHILTKLFLKDFRERNYGFILNVASVAGFMAGPMLSTYYATKNYVLQLTKAIYEELRSDNCNVYIGALCPGPVKTEFNEVAGAEFAVGGITDTEAAEYAINKMFDGELIIIPTAKIKATAFASRFAPTKLMLRATMAVQKARSEMGKSEKQDESTDEPETAASEEAEENNE